MNHAIIYVYVHIYLFIVTREPDDVTVCEGSKADFNCLLDTTDSSISSDNIQWYRFVKNTGITEIIVRDDTNILLRNYTIENELTVTLYITSARKSYTGYYWVETPSFNVCNASLIVSTGL